MNADMIQDLNGEWEYRDACDDMERCEFCGFWCDAGQDCEDCSALCPCMEHRVPLTNVPTDDHMIPECDGCAAEMLRVLKGAK